MSDHSDVNEDAREHPGEGAHVADHGGTDVEEPGRVTSPMQNFGMGEVTTGLIVLVVGLVVVFGIPLLLG